MCLFDASQKSEKCSWCIFIFARLRECTARASDVCVSVRERVQSKSLLDLFQRIFLNNKTMQSYVSIFCKFMHTRSGARRQCDSNEIINVKKWLRCTWCVRCAIAFGNRIRDIHFSSVILCRAYDLQTRQFCVVELRASCTSRLREWKLTLFLFLFLSAYIFDGAGERASRERVCVCLWFSWSCLASNNSDAWQHRMN